MIAEQLASPGALTHIINNCISKQLFPSPWKIARICVTPKVQNISSNNDLHPISILPSLSKIFERLVLRQMSDFVTNTTTGVLNQSISAYRKDHNTTTVMLAMRDDIQRAMKRKLHSQGFSKEYLKWVTTYLTGRRQFVQIDDAVSNTTN
ncbi:Hypothetical predicted protein, partial [Paramuricea clavata]